MQVKGKNENLLYLLYTFLYFCMCSEISIVKVKMNNKISINDPNLLIIYDSLVWLQNFSLS